MAAQSTEDERQWAAEKRDFVGDRRDELADERDRASDVRDLLADAREQALAERERHLEARDAESACHLAARRQPRGSTRSLLGSRRGRSVTSQRPTAAKPRRLARMRHRDGWTPRRPRTWHRRSPPSPRTCSLLTPSTRSSSASPRLR